MEISTDALAENDAARDDADDRDGLDGRDDDGGGIDDADDTKNGAEGRTRYPIPLWRKHDRPKDPPPPPPHALARAMRWFADRLDPVSAETVRAIADRLDPRVRRERASVSHLLDLPEELLLQALGWLDVTSAARTCLCCRTLYRIVAKDDSLWRRYYRRLAGATHDPLYETLIKTHTDATPFWRWLLCARYHPFHPTEDCCGLGFSEDANCLYAGEWKAHRRTGRGLMHKYGRWTYVGGFRDAKAEGFGAIVFDNGSRYEGEWVNDRCHGRGVCISHNGVRYEGEFEHNKRHGRGVMTLPDGSRYQGQWEQDVPQGDGALVTPCGLRYVGGWRSGAMSGQGTMTRASAGNAADAGIAMADSLQRLLQAWKVQVAGDPAPEDALEHSGTWANGHPAGFGTRIFADGRTVIASWRADGTGSLDVTGCAHVEWRGRSFVGEWRFLPFTAPLRMRYPNGDAVDGTWSGTDGDPEGWRLSAVRSFAFSCRCADPAFAGKRLACGWRVVDAGAHPLFLPTDDVGPCDRDAFLAYVRATAADGWGYPPDALDHLPALP